MKSQRHPYVKPFVLRLEYVTDVKVSQACSCKTEGSESGAGPLSECTTELGAPCSACVS
jgi:hypothetical protein